jgi:putative glycosyltransferase (TIGR04372 family)
MNRLRQVLLLRWAYVFSAFAFQACLSIWPSDRRARIQFFIERIHENPANFIGEETRRLQIHISVETDFTEVAANFGETSAPRTLIDQLLGQQTASYLSGENPTKYVEFSRRSESLKSSVAAHEGTDELGFRLIGSEWGAIGHLSLLDVLCKLTKLGLLSEEQHVVAIPPSNCSNQHYLNYWGQYFSILKLDDARARRLEVALDMLYDSVSVFRFKDETRGLYSAWNQAEEQWIGREPLLVLSSEDRIWGDKCLEQMGVNPSGWFVTLHVREGGTRFRSASDSNIDSYQDAINRVIDEGGTVIRMGNPGMRPLRVRSGLIDYAHHPLRSARMDVYLWGAARFFVGTASGPLSVPPTFGVPTLYTNCPAIGINPKWPKSLMIPKLWEDRQLKQPLSFRETLKSKAAWSVNQDQGNLTLVDNEPDMILQAVEDMLSLVDLADNRQTTHDLSPEQKCFNTIRSEVSDTGGAILAPSFAKRFSHLLS